jgi:DNA-directed RNA polymerase subunit RPC12/RpoP
MVYSDSSHQIIFMAIVTLNNYYHDISCRSCNYRILLLSRRPGFRVCKKLYCHLPWYNKFVYYRFVLHVLYISIGTIG